MTTSRTTTTTQPTASTSSRPANPPRPGTPIDEDEDEILREALARAAEAAQKKAAEEAEEERRKKEVAARASVVRRKAVQEARDWASQAQQQNAEVVERRRLLAEAAMARSQRGTLPSEMLVSPRRPVVEPVGGDPDNGNNDDDEEEREPCERCKAKKIPCLQQAGKQSSGSGSSEWMAVMESQMAQNLADLWALREANSKTHQYLRQLLRRQEDDHARLIAMETRMAMMGMGEGPATAGPSRRVKRRIVEESEEEEEEEEEEKEVEEKDGEGEEEETA
ncbi:hypothetical protein F5051DRAFT_445662 [Lentinula edodes]|nr:hypothetical protein F5051DRAFT_445662 [Lentinula edodes]